MRQRESAIVKWNNKGALQNKCKKSSARTYAWPIGVHIWAVFMQPYSDKRDFTPLKEFCANAITLHARNNNFVHSTRTKHFRTKSTF